MPALFPMMVLARLSPVSPKAEHWLLRAGSFACLSGSPAAAQRVRLLWDAGHIPASRLESLLCLTGVMSPMFFLGTLARWTGSRTAAWQMLFVHWLSAGLAALIWHALGRGKPVQTERTGSACASCSLTGAIAQSAQALMAVCGAMMVFSILAALLRSGLLRLFPAWTQKNSPLLAVLWAVMEIGGGAQAVTQAFPHPPEALLCALCSFGGMSIWLQNLLFVPQSIRPVRLLMMRLLHGAAAYALYSAFLKIQNLLTT